MAISEVKNLTGGAVRDSHVKLFIAFEPYFLSEILNLGGLGRTGVVFNETPAFLQCRARPLSTSLYTSPDHRPAGVKTRLHTIT